MKPEQPETMTSKDEVPNSKSEIRNPKQIQSTKSEQEETERTEKEGPSLFPLLTPVLSAGSRISNLAPGGSTGPKDESRIMQALQEYRTAREAGANPNRLEFLTRHADIASELSQCLEALDFVYEAAPKLQDSALEPAGLLQTSEVS